MARGMGGEEGKGQQAVLGTRARGQQLVTVNKRLSAGGEAEAHSCLRGK